MTTRITDRLERKGQPSVAIPIVATAAAVALLIVILFAFTGGEPEEPADEQPVTGAGTNPDGVADEAVEGLENETATEDFIEGDTNAAGLDPLDEAGQNPPGGGSAMDAPDSLQDAETNPPEPATDAANVEPAVGDESGLELTGQDESGEESGSDADAASSEEDGGEGAAQDGDATETEASGEDGDSTQAPADTSTETAEDSAAEAGETTDEFETPGVEGENVVVDPDGTGEPFVPTESGPEGRDDNALTLE